MKGSFSKKATAALLAAALVASTTPLPAQATESYARNITITVDGRTIPQTDQKAFIKDGRTMVPLRTVMEGLNMDVKWNQSDRSITVTSKANRDNSYLFYADKPYFLARTGNHTQYVSLDVAPYITRQNRTVMPLRAIGETYGKVDWDNANSIVKITANKTAQPEPTVKPQEPKVTPQVPPEQAKPEAPKVQEKDQPVWTQEPKDQPGTDKPADYDNPPAGYRYIKMMDSTGNVTYKLVEIHESTVPTIPTDNRDYDQLLKEDAANNTVENHAKEAQEVLDLVNAYRAQAGVQPLKLSPILSKAADIRAREALSICPATTKEEHITWNYNLVTSGNAHNRPDGSEFSTIIKDIGWNDRGFCKQRRLYENLYNTQMHMTSPQLVEGWYNSPGHRRAMLKPNAEYMGYGITTDSPYGFQSAIQLFSWYYQIPYLDQTPNLIGRPKKMAGQVYFLHK